MVVTRTSSFRTPMKTSKPSVTKRIGTPIPPPIRRASEIHPRSFFGKVPSLPPPFDSDSDTEPYDDKPVNRCKCGTKISDHAQECSKYGCPFDQDSMSDKEFKPVKGEALRLEPIVEWKPMTWSYPHSTNGIPLHDLAACMLCVDRGDCVKLYEKMKGCEKGW